MKLQPHETDLIGKRNVTGGKAVEDESCQRIKSLLSGQLQELEFEVPTSNLRIPENGPTVPGTGLWQRRLIESMPIDPSTFRRPPGRPGG